MVMNQICGRRVEDVLENHECVRRVEPSLLISHPCGLPHLGHGRVRKSLSRELQFWYIYLC